MTGVCCDGSGSSMRGVWQLCKWWHCDKTAPGLLLKHLNRVPVLHVKAPWCVILGDRLPIEPERKHTDPNVLIIETSDGKKQQWIHNMTTKWFILYIDYIQHKKCWMKPKVIVIHHKKLNQIEEKKHNVITTKMEYNIIKIPTY